MSGPVLGVIPARLGSTRIPRKPLLPLLGRPLLEWVWRRVSPMTVFDRLVVATDAGEIEEFCRRIGAPVVRTDPAHPSGSDRVAEVVSMDGFREFPLVVNVQGDEPMVQEEHLESAVRLVREEGWEVGTCATAVMGVEQFHSPDQVKVVRARSGAALYFSRAPIPHARDAEPDERALGAPPFLRHIGVYAYRRDVLLRWVALPPSPLEEIERLEQLRALEEGIRIGVAVVRSAAPGVDTEADRAVMERLLKNSYDHLTAANRT